MSYFNCNIYKSKNWNKDLNTKKQTNADKIRNMTDEELADIISCPYGGCDNDYRNCIKCKTNWLKAERT